ncbi:hypothetical protein [Psychrobium sp. 1_MG-2023]|uniref:hypothetical protein n=1 Tax=Psychrobium sp. 1_MG-2023 TaxID=3062624 RepID=UPI000C33910D|nr:hypothetical protein [Psychrobium sp. 1_MG-2023]MDP2560884.1 hypothetical protein [Psychrobium sp. 1_MG-2023]PKF55959.1 hypothetical protein CW748_11095 [Alteromonadales bacterium alter-6D02]
MIRGLVSLLWIIAFSSNAQQAKLAPFTTDGCSLFPDGTLASSEQWLHCCVQHDFDYWQGGTAKQRQRSDRELLLCVAKAGHPHIASLMLTGVRVGGHPYWYTPFRWGYGWPYPKAYAELTPAEMQLVEQRVLEIPAELLKLLEME